MPTNYYVDKALTYYTQPRRDLVSLLVANPSQKVLEIGAGGGDTLLYIKEQKAAAEVVGVDIFRLENTNQNHPLIDNFLVLDIEREALNYPEAYFDAIVCGDVIEHLVDPWAAIRKLSAHLKPGGLFIISTPNFRHIDNFMAINVRGDFKYNPDGGLLDKTHLRFFCKKNIRDLVITNELRFKSITRINAFPQNPSRWWVRIFDALTFNLFEEFTVLQYVVVGERT
ncbi:methyltransferase domain-containing protein [Fibrella sp. ES10-3-2-2]|nr:hypothetical protein A6C57_08740 [Fibrella sp. ES10-3-2-2]